MKEKRKGAKAIGTTGRGIGPAYVSKVARIGIRMIDLLDTNILHQKLIQNIEDINRALENIYKEPIIDAQELIHELEGAITKLSPYICYTKR